LRTDVVVASESRWLVLDAKFYTRTLQVDERFGRPRLHSDHLYQMYAYLQNLARRPGAPDSVEGMLVYPRVDRDVAVDVEIHGLRVRAVTVDLRRAWCDVHADLLALLRRDRPPRPSLG
jgi:5-methylcytosine-specific restriction enzyme subunit McrC